MQGRIGIAPCGHTGEAVIGNFYVCLLGCDGPIRMSRRGEPGHVENCACKPCQIRRKTVTVVLRSGQGTNVVSLPWDGAANEITFTPPVGGFVMHYRFLDKDGNIVVQGNLQDVYLEPGYPATLKVSVLVDASVSGMMVSNIVTKKKVTYKTGSIKITFMGHTIQGYAPVNIPTNVQGQGACDPNDQLAWNFDTIDDDDDPLTNKP